VNVYFETSAIIKLVVAEEGSTEASDIWNGADLLVTSRLSYPEARAALAAARRSGRISRRQLDDAKSALEERFAEMELIEVSEDVTRSAGDLAELRGLRGYDAVHLASVLTLGLEDTVMVTWDRDLADAARRAGLDHAGVPIDQPS